MGRKQGERRRWQAKARRTVLLAAGFFLATHVAFLFYREYGNPTLCDPEYGRKLAALRRRQAERPGAPLVVLLGSSRVALGMCPGCLADADAVENRSSNVINSGICGAGPIFELMCLRRLLDDGVRPDRLIVEVWPMLLSESYYQEVNVLMLELSLHRYRWRDLRLVRRYHPNPNELSRQWYNRQRLPLFSYRATALTTTMPDLVLPEMRNDATWRLLDGWGFLVLEGRTTHPPPEQFNEQVRGTMGGMKHFLEPFAPAGALEWALRDLVALARKHSIPISFVLMPEPRAVGDWYHSEAIQNGALRYVHRLAGELGVELFDTIDWLPDEDFADANHLTPDGARNYTRRFEREILRPLLRGEKGLTAGIP
jgi:hypothetical protein